MLFLTGTPLSRARPDRRDHDHRRRHRELGPAGVFSRASDCARAAVPLAAALEAGATRIRPVLMTAFAMIVGVIPMALGLGEGAEQNAPLGRAVIGGLLFATFSTLLFVPLVFAGAHSLRAHSRNPGPSRDRKDPRKFSAAQRRRPPASAAPEKSVAQCARCRTIHSGAAGAGVGAGGLRARVGQGRSRNQGAGKPKGVRQDRLAGAEPIFERLQPARNIAR